MSQLFSILVLVILLTLVVCDLFCFWAASKIDKSTITWTTVLMPMSGFWMLFNIIRKMESV